MAIFHATDSPHSLVVERVQSLFLNPHILHKFGDVVIFHLAILRAKLVGLLLTGADADDSARAVDDAVSRLAHFSAPFGWWVR